MKLLKCFKNGPEEESSGSEHDACADHFSVTPAMLKPSPSTSNLPTSTPAIPLMALEVNDFLTSLQTIPHA